MIVIRPVAAFRDNYIWLACDQEQRRAAIVDPGDAAPVLAALAQWQLQPCAILATHLHADHVGGIAGLLGHFDVPVYGPGAEDIPGRTHAVAGGDQVHIAPLGITFTVLDVPGHTRGHIAYHGAGVVFVGDTLFMAGCGRLFEGTAGQMLASLDRIAALPDDTLVYCAHEYTLSNLRFALHLEPDNAHLAARQADCETRRAAGEPTVPATLALEKLTNPFLRTRQSAVRAAASRYLQRAVASDTDVFAAVRAWKDNF